MPKYRGEDGQVEHDPTVVNRRPSQRSPSAPAGKTIFDIDDDDDTEIAGKQSGAAEEITRPRPRALQDSDRTVLAGRIKSSGRDAVDDEEELDEVDPVVGWLVIIEGPGRGRSLILGPGMNSIGRDSSERVAIPFGDKEISRSGHATVTFEPRGKMFFISQGNGTNLTYCNEKPVLVPMELNARDQIRVGETLLQFIPFCGADFDWS